MKRAPPLIFQKQEHVRPFWFGALAPDPACEAHARAARRGRRCAALAILVVSTALWLALFAAAEALR